MLVLLQAIRREVSANIYFFVDVVVVVVFNIIYLINKQ